jgi:small subunit ribosomal protein S16
MVKIRLMRMGAAKRPFYRVVVADSRGPRDGRFIENIGKYHPLEDPSLVQIDEERALYWLSQGAQPTEQVQSLLKAQGIWERFESSKPKPAS